MKEWKTGVATRRKTNFEDDDSLHETMIIILSNDCDEAEDVPSLPQHYDEADDDRGRTRTEQDAAAALSAR
jgi:hypothetical protein